MLDAIEETREADAAAKAFAALGGPARLEVLRMLVRAGPEGLTMGALQERIGLAGSTLTHHMRQLTTAGLARQEKRARQVICRVEYDAVRALAAYLLRECCADACETAEVERKEPNHE